MMALMEKTIPRQNQREAKETFYGASGVRCFSPASRRSSLRLCAQSSYPQDPQMSVLWTLNPGVAGSSPVSGAICSFCKFEDCKEGHSLTGMAFFISRAIPSMFALLPKGGRMPCATTKVRQSKKTTSLIVRLKQAISTQIFAFLWALLKIKVKLKIFGLRSKLFLTRAGIFRKFFYVTLTLLVFSPVTEASNVKTGIATWYSVRSTLAEGNSGITASGEKLNERALTCAIRSRDFGKMYRVTNIKNGKSLVCRHNDFGPGKKPTKRGVIVDLTPKAFDLLGGKRGEGWGEFPVKVEAVKS